MLKAKEIRQLSNSEFESKMISLRKDMMKLRAQKSSGTNPENPGRISADRRAIARMLTIKKEKGGTSKKQ